MIEDMALKSKALVESTTRMISLARMKETMLCRTFFTVLNVNLRVWLPSSSCSTMAGHHLEACNQLRVDHRYALGSTRNPWR